MVTLKVGYERFINILAVILPFLVAEVIVHSIFETKMLVTKPTCKRCLILLFSCGLFFPQVSLTMAILKTHKTRTDNERMVDVTNVSHQETKTLYYKARVVVLNKAWLNFSRL